MSATKARARAFFSLAEPAKEVSLRWLPLMCGLLLSPVVLAMAQTTNADASQTRLTNKLNPLSLPANTNGEAAFSVKRIANDAIYIAGGRNAGMKEGMKLTIKRSGAMRIQSAASEATGSWIVARLEIVTVAATSSICKIIQVNDEVKKGDIAYLEGSAAATSPRNESNRDAQAVSFNSSNSNFFVKYIASDAIYITGGRNAGMKEGMNLTIKRSGALSVQSAVGEAKGNSIVARVEIVTVAATSAVCKITHANGEVQKGDIAYLEGGTAATSSQNGSNKDVQAASFISHDSGGQKVNNRQQSSEIGRMKGRIGFDYGYASSTGSTVATSRQLSIMADTDITQIAGTHWSLNGTWRGRLTSHNQQGVISTLQDTLNHTYQMELSYANPNSPWVAGFGRLYLPWASSLNTFDGGYVGRRVGSAVTAGIFAGSNPETTSFQFHYSPDNRIGGVFVNFEGGSFNAVHISTTVGGALNSVKWKLDRPLVFLENAVYYKRSISIYHTLIADAPRGVTTSGLRLPPGINRSYLTVRFQPHARISFDINHNYFRDVPTPDEQLIATGLLDRVLYQGLSVGMHVEPVRHIVLYTTIGETNRTGDTRRNRNQVYGATVDQILRTGIVLDTRYSKFDSSFGQGDFRAVSLSRNQGGGRWRLSLQGGTQTLLSGFTANHHSRFLNTSSDLNLGSHTFVQGNYTIERGNQLNYEQWFFTMGYRFDARTIGQ